MPRKTATPAAADSSLIWSYLIHLGFNMWGDAEAPQPKARKLQYIPATDYLRCEADYWRTLIREIADGGANMVIIDLGEGVKYESHPELAVKGSWSGKRLRRELAYIRKLGMEPIPKLNFSACHDQWLGPYARMLSTDTYYGVCKDVITEALDLFDRPRFFHLGMDEETAAHQAGMSYAVLRQFDLWWHDFYILLDAVERANVRGWVWSDYVWNHPDRFYKKMPKSVLQSNWYYGKQFRKSIPGVRAYLDLDERGYDQVPTGSNWAEASNFPDTVTYCSKRLSPQLLKGFMQTPWFPTVSAARGRHTEAVKTMVQGIGRMP